MSETEEFDLAVIGGGPAGSTLATLVAMQGHRVVLLEKEKFPRHQIGESLLPATIHGVLPLLGVSEEIKNAKFMRKLGGTFRWGKSSEPWTFSFAASPKMAEPTGYAYQVERSRFDAILLNNARKKGVDVREQKLVDEVIKEGDRIVGVRCTDGSGKSHFIKSRFVADTSGNLSRIYEHVGQRVYSKFFQNVALYGYYRNGKRLPSPNDGNILCAAFDGGWFWYIPLSQSLTSVGAVVARERMNHLQVGQEKAMQELIAACPLIQDYLKNAERVTEGQYGQFRVRKDYSYCCTKFWAPGAVLVGDAACFVDPVFSSGVHLATYSALLAARSINSCLRDGLDEQQAFTEFEMRYRREYGKFYQFLVGFYDINQDENSYFWSARKMLNSPEEANQAFVELVGGVAAAEEPLFGGSQDFFASMHSLGKSFHQASSVPGQFDQKKLDHNFMMGFTREITQIQFQALTGEASGEVPFWKGGLIPSTDGLHWQRVS